MAKNLSKQAVAGFVEKNDVLVTVAPGEIDRGIQIDLQSVVQKQYGKHIKQLVEQTIKAAGFQAAEVQLIDKGAWDYTIEARVLAALERGMNDE